MATKNEIKNESLGNTEGVGTTPEVPKDTRVKIFVPKTYATDDPNLYVGVNGVGYLLPRGEEALVPPHVAKEIERSLKAESMQDRRARALRDKTVK